MQAIIFDKDMRRLEHFTNCTWQHIKNYIKVDQNIAFIGIINSEEYIDGEAIVENSKVIFGKTIETRKLKELTVNFDFNFFEYNINVINSEPYLVNKDKIIKNLIHIYNGGSVESVPFPMPVTKIIETLTTEFVKHAEQDIQVYSLEQAVDQFMSKLK